MGNINALRDWGHAKDYVRMQWMMLQQDTPQDFVIATGLQYSVRQFIQWSAAELGIELSFQGEGINEFAAVESIEGDSAPMLVKGQVIMRIDPGYFRPAEVSTLLGDASKARNQLGWTPKISAREMCAEMINEDLKNAKRMRLLADSGLELPISIEN
tara:strand:+ start:196 stop:666 length:471 start_codon:yes stop_codon:yes gene_type:complete